MVLASKGAFYNCGLNPTSPRKVVLNFLVSAYNFPEENCYREKL